MQTHSVDTELTFYSSTISVSSCLYESSHDVVNKEHVSVGCFVE